MNWCGDLDDDLGDFNSIGVVACWMVLLFVGFVQYDNDIMTRGEQKLVFTDFTDW